MSWGLVLGLAAIAYGFKALGVLVLGTRRVPARLERCFELVPAALLAALIARDTVTTGHDVVLDARLAGVAVAAVATWRRAPFVLAVVLACAVTAALRQVG
jgi:branched-subunit amino acid transport protein